MASPGSWWVALLLTLMACGAPERPRGESAKDAAAEKTDGGGQTRTPDVKPAIDGAGPTDEPTTCDETPTRRGGVRLTVTVAVELIHGGKPVKFGEPFTVGGGTFTLTNFRFYVSELALLGAEGASVPVDLVGGDGTPVPYNVHLVNGEEPSGMTLRLAAPTGEYTGLSLLLGLTDACNRQDPGASKPPLTASSQMTWPPPFGYLFLRSEAQTFGVPGVTVPTEIHLGGMPGTIPAPRVTAKGAVRVTSPAGGGLRLRVALDELFHATTLPADESKVFSPDQAVLLGSMCGRTPAPSPSSR